VVDISYKKKDVYVGPPEVKHLSTYTVDGENCGSSQEKPLDSFVRTKSVSITHEESLELGNSLENTFGWSQSQESTIEWSESASMSMEVPLKGASLGMEHSMTKTWSKTSAFAQEGGVTKGANTNKLTAITKQVEETVEFSGISKDVPPYAWYRHRAYYHERPIQMTLTLKVQCIVNGKNAMEKEIPGTKLVTATESVLKFFPMEDLTGNCKNTHSEYGTCKCFGLRSNFHTSTGCQPRMNPDGTTGGRPGCYVYKDAGCTDAIGLKDADPEKFRGDFALIRKISSDYPVDGSMFRWSYMPCDARCKKPTGCGSKTDVYSNIDCDGDGILDHVCTNGGNRWVALSSKGDCKSWVSDKKGKCEGRCKKPTGCVSKNDVYKHMDCDGDGILDHVCTNGANRWVALSSKGDCRTFVSDKNGKCEGTCKKPAGCAQSTDIYSHVDCDGDGILDHLCTTTNNDNRWVALSSKGKCGTFVSDKKGKCVAHARCQRPKTGCVSKNDVYKHIDCDGDGILDHVCTNGANRWVALSSKGDCKTFVSEKNGKCVGTSRRRSTADRLVDMMESKALETDPSPDHSSAPLKEFAA